MKERGTARATFLATGTARARFLERAGRRVVDAEVELFELARGARSRDVPAEIVELSLEVVRLAEELAPDEARALFFLALSAFTAVRQGSTRVPIGPEMVEVLEVLTGDVAQASAAFADIERLLEGGRARAVIGEGREFKPLVVEGRHVYLQRLLREEERFVEAIAKRSAKGAFSLAREAVEAALADVIARPAVGRRGPVDLSGEQRKAILRAVLSPLTVISGGPGTGKTSIVVSLLRVLVRLGLAPETFALAAPTGKAANRLAESIERTLADVTAPSAHDEALRLARPEPRTLHRLLGYSPDRDRFLHHESSPLSERTVVVDESSMIDLFLMDRLARAVRLDARLVLLGDAEQLPSVDAGTVLRDITSARESDPLASLAVTLHQSFRMDPQDPAGRNVLCCARAIKSGRAPFEVAEAEAGERITVRRSAETVSFHGVELFEADGDAARAREQLLDRFYVEQLAEHEHYPRLASKVYGLTDGEIAGKDREDAARLFAHLESFKILSVTRSAAQRTGAEAINASLHARAVRDAITSGADPRRVSGESFLPGEPVIAVKNDYDRRLFNGDQGVVLDVQDEDGARRRMAVFRVDGRFAAFHVETMLGLLDPAYALTVHKAQGSELDVVVVLLPERDTPIFTREILYTALTRSRRSVVLVGDRAQLRRGVERRVVRWSGVSERLGRLRPKT